MRLITLIIAMLYCLAVNAQTDTLKISTAYTTHIIFSTDITYADLSNNRIVAAKIVEHNRNILAVKAKCPFEETTSISALEANGTMHTYIVGYEENPQSLIVDEREQATIASKEGQMRTNVTSNRRSDAPTLSQMSSCLQALYHIGARKYGIMVLCENIISYSDMTYIVLSLENRSSVSYNITDATFVVESKKKSKRSVVFEQTLFPKNRFGTLSTEAGHKQIMVYSLNKQTLSENQVIKVYLYEEDGQRNLEMTIDTKDINKAENPL